MAGSFSLDRTFDGWVWRIWKIDFFKFGILLSWGLFGVRSTPLCVWYGYCLFFKNDAMLPLQNQMTKLDQSFVLTLPFRTLFTHYFLWNTKENKINLYSLILKRQVQFCSQNDKNVHKLVLVADVWQKAFVGFEVNKLEGSVIDLIF